MSILVRAVVVGIPAVFLCVGCEQPVDPAVTALQQKLILSAAPDAEKSISKIRAALQAEDAAEVVDVVIRGRIHAGDLPPWESGEAAFMLTDASGHDGETDHDPHTCPFCSRNITDYLAKIRFHDKDGSVVRIDSRELLGVSEKQLVLIKGQGRIDDEGLLAVSADGIYIVR